MHIITRRTLLEAASRHSALAPALDVWYRIAKKQTWRNLAEVRIHFPSADAVGKFTVFNIKGNTYRLIVVIQYDSARIYIRHVLTHAEYDKGAWKL